jgi:hypothetical protein
MKTKRVPAFQQLGYILTTVGLNRVAAALRYVALRLSGFDLEKTYEGDLAGYVGYIKHPRLGVLAFRRLDGTLQYRW